MDYGLSCVPTHQSGFGKVRGAGSGGVVSGLAQAERVVSLNREIGIGG